MHSSELATWNRQTDAQTDGSRGQNNLTESRCFPVARYLASSGMWRAATTACNDGLTAAEFCDAAAAAAAAAYQSTVSAISPASQASSVIAAVIEIIGLTYLRHSDADEAAAGM